MAYCNDDDTHREYRITAAIGSASLTRVFRLFRRLHGPEALELVEVARGLLHHVYDDVGKVDEDPFSTFESLDPQRRPRFHKLLKAFERRTGCPVLINTSFNVRGEPIVCSPEHAYRCFMGTNMDVLVIENVVLLKERQPQAKEHEIDEYLAQFQLD